MTSMTMNQVGTIPTMNHPTMKNDQEGTSNQFHSIPLRGVMTTTTF